MSPVSEKKATHNFLIYGESGSGKTTLAGSAHDSQMGPVLFLDIEGGTNSIIKKYPGVQTIRISSDPEVGWESLQQIYEILADGGHGFNTVIIDSLSEAQTLNMATIMRKTKKEDVKGSVNEDVPSMREWGISLSQMQRFIKAYRDLPINTIFTCLADTERNDRGKRDITPMLSGKLKGKAAGFMDEVYYLYVDGDGDRVIQTALSEDTVAKSRSSNLEPLLANATMADIYELINS